MPENQETLSPLVLELIDRYPEGSSKSWGTRLRNWTSAAESVKVRIDDFLSGESKEILKSPRGWELINSQGLAPECALELLTSLASGMCSPKRVLLGRVTPETAIPTVLAFVDFSGESWVAKIQHRELLDRGQRALGYLGNHVQTLNEWATFQPEGAQHLVVQVAPHLAGEIISPPYPPDFVKNVAKAMIKTFCTTYSRISRSGEIPTDLLPRDLNPLITNNILWHPQRECCVVIDADVETATGKIWPDSITGEAAETILSQSYKLGGRENLPFSYSAGGKELTFDPSILAD